MKSIRHRVVSIGVCAALFAPLPGCATNDTAVALADWSASTAGGLVEILVGAVINQRIAEYGDPDLTAAISDQEH